MRRKSLPLPQLKFELISRDASGYNPCLYTSFWYQTICGAFFLVKENNLSNLSIRNIFIFRHCHRINCDEPKQDYETTGRFGKNIPKLHELLLHKTYRTTRLIITFSVWNVCTFSLHTVPYSAFYTIAAVIKKCVVIVTLVAITVLHIVKFCTLLQNLSVRFDLLLTRSTSHFIIWWCLISPVFTRLANCWVTLPN